MLQAFWRVMIRRRQHRTKKLSLGTLIKTFHLKIWPMTQWGIKPARKLWSEIHLSLSNSLKEMRGAVLVTPVRPPIQHGICCAWVIHRGLWMVLVGESNHKAERWGFPTKALGSNKNLTAKQQGMADWKPFCLSQLVLYCLDRLSFRFTQTPRIGVPGDYIQRSLPSPLTLWHGWIFGLR